MKVRIISVIILLISSNQFAFGQQPDWLEKIKSLTLLTSTRDDVIKVFGNPNRKIGNDWEYFHLIDGEVRIRYSIGKCETLNFNGKETPVGWLVPEGTVIEIDFKPSKKIKPKKLNFDLSKFYSYPDGDSLYITIYQNDELGINFALYKESITYMTFYPSNKLKDLHCK